MNPQLLSPSPEVITINFNTLSRDYILKVILAIAAIVFFFISYFVLVAFFGYCAYYAIIYDVESISMFSLMFKVGAIAASIMLFVFSLKFIFSLKNHKPLNRIKLVKKDNEKLFSFIDAVCKEAQAPRPKNIYIDPDVNASVNYSNVWQSLFLPTKKELTIGLGLVSTLNMSEFKAVIAHEFGHFSQKSMKVGSYIHSANTIIYDMIFNRDKFDVVLDHWRSTDIRLSAAAWVITPVIMCLREILMLFYTLLNRMDSLLSREMEFNADKVAVKTSGSEAIVSALWKLEYGYTRWNIIVDHAHLATKKKIFSKNLYLHNYSYYENEKAAIETVFENLPLDHNGKKIFFPNSNNSKVSMYASHPPNDLREKNAKSPFISCEIDSRSAWILFENEIEIQQKLTGLVYQNYLDQQQIENTSEEDFKNFIAAESNGKLLLEEYDNTFLNRFITIPSTSTIIGYEDKNVNREEILSELKILMIPVTLLETLLENCNEIYLGTTNQKTITYKDVTYKKKNITTLVAILISDREFIFNSNFKIWDEKFIAYLYQQSRLKSKQELFLKICVQQKTIVDFFQFLIFSKNNILTKINDLKTTKEVSMEMVSNLSSEIKEIVKEINEKSDAFYKIDFVNLPNIESVQELKNSVFENGFIEKELGMIFENGGLDRIMFAIENGILNSNRVENKNLEMLIQFSKNID